MSKKKIGEVQRESGDGRLELWKKRLSDSELGYKAELEKMSKREGYYLGDTKIYGNYKPKTAKKTERTPYLRNIVRELIEAQIDTNIPMPKVTAMREQDVHLAKKIEDMLRSQINRLPAEELIDLNERTVPIQGGSFWFVEWLYSDAKGGNVNLKAKHPRCVIPAEGGVDFDEMDYWFIKIPTTKAAVMSRYGVDVDELSEDEPELRRPASEERDTSDEYVTVIQAYYRNDDGSIGLFAWAGDKVLQDIKDYRARRRRVCSRCKTVMPKADGKVCRNCGCESFEYESDEFEEITMPTAISGGEVIEPNTPVEALRELPSGKSEAVTEYETTKIPRYVPNVCPIIVQKNVSSFDKLLGDSDVDVLIGAQDQINSLYAKVVEKLYSGGSLITLPSDASIEVSGDDMKVVRLANAADKSMIDVYNLQPSISGDFQLLAEIYEEARQAIGITDSFQGRKDTTATSGTAKQYAAQLAAGRLESKRAMKRAAFARIFEAMFKYMLAYSDRPMKIMEYSNGGVVGYGEFDRFEFLERDEYGDFKWNDSFIFECDTSAPLAQDRAAMWQETRMYFNEGAFGDPSDPSVRAYFWGVMEELHYPGAARMKKFCEQQGEQLAAAQAQAQGAAVMPGGEGAVPNEGGEIPSEIANDPEMMKAYEFALKGAQRR